jgi:hypothetical protein
MPTLFDELPEAQLIQACAGGNRNAWNFLGQVSPGERRYIHQELLKDWPADRPTRLSDANKRQLHHRAVRRLRRLLDVPPHGPAGEARRLVSCGTGNNRDES